MALIGSLDENLSSLLVKMVSCITMAVQKQSVGELIRIEWVHGLHLTLGQWLNSSLSSQSAVEESIVMHSLIK